MRESLCSERRSFVKSSKRRQLEARHIVSRRARFRNFMTCEEQEGRKEGETRRTKKRTRNCKGREGRRKGSLSRWAVLSAAGFSNRFRTSERALCCNCFAVGACIERFHGGGWKRENECRGDVAEGVFVRRRGKREEKKRRKGKEKKKEKRVERSTPGTNRVGAREPL